MKTESQTLAFQASPPGEAALQLIIVCGPHAEHVFQPLFSPGSWKKVVEGGSAVGFLRLGSSEKLDEAVIRRMDPTEVFHFSDQAFEVSVHGSQVIVEAFLRSAERRGVQRVTSADFFSTCVQRGVLSRIESDAGLRIMDAKSEEAAAALCYQVEGGLLKSIRRALQCDEQNDKQLLSAILDDLIATIPVGLALTRPRRIAIVGPTNAGKSSLFNALVGEERVIVSDTHGTTRDPVREETTFGGFPILLIDTAGLRVTDDPLEILSLVESEREFRDADLWIAVLDGADPPEGGVEQWLRARGNKPAMVLQNKTDLYGREVPHGVALPWICGSLRRGPGRVVENVVSASLSALALPAAVPQRTPLVFEPWQEETIREAREALDSGASARAVLGKMLAVGGT